MKFDNLHQILRSLYEQMMPLCGDMAGVAKGIAGLGALFYVAYRVWQSLARAEPIDVFPMPPAVRRILTIQLKGLRRALPLVSRPPDGKPVR